MRWSEGAGGGQSHPNTSFSWESVILLSIQPGETHSGWPLQQPHSSLLLSSKRAKNQLRRRWWQQPQVSFHEHLCCLPYKQTVISLSCRLRDKSHQLHSGTTLESNGHITCTPAQRGRNILRPCHNYTVLSQKLNTHSQNQSGAEPLTRWRAQSQKRQRKKLPASPGLRRCTSTGDDSPVRG